MVIITLIISVVGIGLGLICLLIAMFFDALSDVYQRYFDRAERWCIAIAKGTIAFGGISLILCVMALIIKG